MKPRCAPNNRMQSDKLLRYASQFAADAERYVKNLKCQKGHNPVKIPFQSVLIMAILAFSVNSSAKGADGTYLLSHCKHYLVYLNSSDENYAAKHVHSIGYCQGYVDSLRSVTSQIQQSLNDDLFRVCIPQGVRNDQIARVLTNFLVERPDLLHWNSGTVALMSLMDAFPCQK